MSPEWFCYINGQVYGPLDAQAIRELAKRGQLKPTDQVKRGETGHWVMASSIKGLTFGTTLAVAPSQLSSEEVAEPMGLLSSAKNEGDLSPLPLGEVVEPKPSWISLLTLRENLSALLSCAALVVALVALGVVVFRDPLGSGIRHYDLSTPRASLESQIKMELDGDIRARLELQRQIQGKMLKERLSTLRVRKEAIFRGKKILFLAYKENGVDKYLTKSFEKDANTGFWLPTYVSTYEVTNEDKDLAAQMKRWEESGELTEK